MKRILQYRIKGNLPHYECYINNAFLNGDLSEVVYMAQPRDFEDSTKPHHVCRLNKALYGLKQAPQAWFTKLKHYLITDMFRACRSNTSLFVHHSIHVTIYTLVYVDDVIVTDNNATFLDQFINRLNKTFSLRDLGSLHYFLGLQVTRSNTSLTLSQQQYIQEVISKGYMTSSKPASIPTDPAMKLNNHESR